MYKRLAVIADIHGNFPALKAVIEAIRKLDCDAILSLGDVAGYYCMINECIECCRSAGVFNVLGNHDSYLLTGTGCPRSMSANLCLEYQRQYIEPQNIQWLARSLPEYRDDYFWGVHGSWNNLLDDYLECFDFNRLPQPVRRVYASAHTHVQKIQKAGITTYFNPGAVGQPRDNNPLAAFAVFVPPDQVTLYRVPYNIDEICQAMQSAGFEERYFTCLKNGTRIQTYKKV